MQSRCGDNSHATTVSPCSAYRSVSSGRPLQCAPRSRRGPRTGDHAGEVPAGLGRHGHPQAVAGEARASSRPGRWSSARGMSRWPSCPSTCSASRRCWAIACGRRSAGSPREHPHRLDPHAQRPRLLRLPRRPRRPHRRPGVHRLRLRQGRRGDQRGDRPPPAGLDQGRHGRGQGQDRLQLLRARPLRPADERHPGRDSRGQDDRHAGQLRHPSRGAGQRRRHHQPGPGRPALRADRVAGRGHGPVHEQRPGRHGHRRQPQPGPAQGPAARLLERRPHLGGMPADRPPHGRRGAAHRQGRPGPEGPVAPLRIDRRCASRSSPTRCGASSSTRR